VLVMRLVTETAPDLLLAPRRPPGKTDFTRMLDAEMRRRGTRQGARSSSACPSLDGNDPGTSCPLLDPAPPIA
jgi:radical SAM superfamily enzyme